MSRTKEEVAATNADDDAEVKRRLSNICSDDGMNAAVYDAHYGVDKIRLITGEDDDTTRS